MKRKIDTYRDFIQSVLKPEEIGPINGLRPRWTSFFDNEMLDVEFGDAQKSVLLSKSEGGGGPPPGDGKGGGGDKKPPPDDGKGGGDNKPDGQQPSSMNIVTNFMNNLGVGNMYEKMEKENEKNPPEQPSYVEKAIATKTKELAGDVNYYVNDMKNDFSKTVERTGDIFDNAFGTGAIIAESSSTAQTPLKQDVASSSGGWISSFTSLLPTFSNPFSTTQVTTQAPPVNASSTPQIPVKKEVTDVQQEKIKQENRSEPKKQVDASSTPQIPVKKEVTTVQQQKIKQEDQPAIKNEPPKKENETSNQEKPDTLSANSETMTNIPSNMPPEQSNNDPANSLDTTNVQATQDEPIKINMNNLEDTVDETRWYSDDTITNVIKSTLQAEKSPHNYYVSRVVFQAEEQGLLDDPQLETAVDAVHKELKNGKKIALIPINETRRLDGGGGTHWTAAVVTQSDKTRKIYYHNPLEQGGSNQDTRDFIEGKLTKDGYKVVVSTELNRGKQEDSHSCGPYVAEFLTNAKLTYDQLPESRKGELNLDKTVDKLYETPPIDIRKKHFKKVFGQWYTEYDKNHGNLEQGEKIALTKQKWKALREIKILEKLGRLEKFSPEGGTKDDLKSLNNYVQNRYMSKKNIKKK